MTIERVKRACEKRGLCFEITNFCDSVSKYRAWGKGYNLKADTLSGLHKLVSPIKEN